MTGGFVEYHPQNYHDAMQGWSQDMEVISSLVHRAAVRLETFTRLREEFLDDLNDRLTYKLGLRFPRWSVNMVSFTVIGDTVWTARESAIRDHVPGALVVEPADPQFDRYDGIHPRQTANWSVAQIVEHHQADVSSAAAWMRMMSDRLELCHEADAWMAAAAPNLHFPDLFRTRRDVFAKYVTIGFPVNAEQFEQLAEGGEETVVQVLDQIVAAGQRAERQTLDMQIDEGPDRAFGAAVPRMGDYQLRVDPAQPGVG
jgi:hypothetical protein